MELLRDFYVGVVEENIDPAKKGRIKVRVQTLYHGIDVKDIPWAYPFGDLSGKEFSVPAIGKLVNVLYLSDDLYSPYYIYSENNNINLQTRLNGLSDDEYTRFSALLYDDRTQIYSDDNSLSLDYYYNKISIERENINLELKDNTRTLNLGSKNAGQEAVLGTRFFDWMDKFINEFRKIGSMVDSSLGPLTKTGLDIICDEYTAIREDFVSRNVKIVDNNAVNSAERPSETYSSVNDIDLILPKDADYANLLNRINMLNAAGCEELTSANVTDYVPTSSEMVLPLLGVRVSCRFGPRQLKGEGVTFHGGIDIAAPTGTVVVSSFDGIVVSAAFDSIHGGGNTIVIKHTNGFKTGYCHLSKMLVNVNAIVKTGNPIGLVGNTGTHSFGSHLHFSVTTPANKKVDPELYFEWPSRKGDKQKGSNTGKGEYKGSVYTASTSNFPCDVNNNVSLDDIYDSPIVVGDSVSAAAAKKSADTYLGRAMSITEWNMLIRAVYAEASHNTEERAWCMAVMLNRARTKGGSNSVYSILTAKNQFQSVTGTNANGHRPSKNFTDGPNTKNQNSIFQCAIYILSKVPKNIVKFTAASTKAYGAGTNIGYRNNLLASGGITIGGTVFG